MTDHFSTHNNQIAKLCNRWENAEHTVRKIKIDIEIFMKKEKGMKENKKQKNEISSSSDIGFATVFFSSSD